ECLDLDIEGDVGLTFLLRGGVDIGFAGPGDGDGVLSVTALDCDRLPEGRLFASAGSAGGLLRATRGLLTRAGVGEVGVAGRVLVVRSVAAGACREAHDGRDEQCCDCEGLLPQDVSLLILTRVRCSRVRREQSRGPLFLLDFW